MHLFMTSAKVEQEVKLVDVIDLNEKNREINTKESLPCNVENFSIKLNPGRPVWNAVISYIIFFNSNQIPNLILIKCFKFMHILDVFNDFFDFLKSTLRMDNSLDFN